MCKQTPDFNPGDRSLDEEVCECRHLFKTHNEYGCRHNSDEAGQCHCALGRWTIEARLWARRMYQRATEAETLLEYYRAWRNANDPYA